MKHISSIDICPRGCGVSDSVLHLCRDCVFVKARVEDLVTFVRNSYGYDFCSLNCTLAHQNPVTVHHWLPPPLGWSKINIDASFLSPLAPASTGVMVRDDQGFILGSCYRILQRSPSAFMYEAIVVLQGL
ncbi:hypothetical protein V6N12_035817 [Hibiscus sabdariffa]|uniref:RNase H type-1 domain-containing protein n=1 Tax=Hibiscus sabdariffa TaxID=183260 RepID=A0ABR2EQK8_9ROSI